MTTQQPALGGSSVSSHDRCANEWCVSCGSFLPSIPAPEQASQTLVKTATLLSQPLFSPTLPSMKRTSPCPWCLVAISGSVPGDTGSSGEGYRRRWACPHLGALLPTPASMSNSSAPAWVIGGPFLSGLLFRPWRSYGPGPCLSQDKSEALLNRTLAP